MNKAVLHFPETNPAREVQYKKLQYWPQYKASGRKQPVIDLLAYIEWMFQTKGQKE